MEDLFFSEPDAQRTPPEALAAARARLAREDDLTVSDSDGAVRVDQRRRGRPSTAAYVFARGERGSWFHVTGCGPEEQLLAARVIEALGRELVLHDREGALGARIPPDGALDAIRAALEADGWIVGERPVG